MPSRIRWCRKSAPAATVSLTLETLDRYIQYRRESDAAEQADTAAMLQQAQQGSAITLNLEKMSKRNEALRAKHGLPNEGFQYLDRLVRDISEARFKSESATARAALKQLEAQANGPASPERDMARAMMAFWKKDLQADPTLRKEREAYGDAAVDLVLQREKELKELWTAKDAAASRAFGALDAQPASP